MVKISFGLSKSTQNEKETTKVSNKLSNVFSKADVVAEKPVKKQFITELSTNDINLNDEDDDELRKYVIPCKNSLKDLKTEVKEEVKQKVSELKYGLNVLFEEDSELKLKSKVEEEAGSYNTHDIDKPVATSENKDEEIAKLIIEETNRKRLHEELFGTNDLVVKSQKITPILLRSRLNTASNTETPGSTSNQEDDSQEKEGGSGSGAYGGDGGGGSARGKDEGRTNSEEKDRAEEEVNIKKLLEVKMDQYENVPVEKFGLAMLLGMGFDPKKNKNEPKVYKRRVFDKAGLGADTVMKSNMESIMDTKLMAKLKRNHIYNIGEGTATTVNWTLPGIWVKVTDKNHEDYKKKGLVKSVKNNMVKVIIEGKEKDINFKYLETVVSKEGKLHKVVRRIPMRSKKEYIEIGTLVKLIEKKEDAAKIIYEKEELTVSLDSISQVSD
ncbi:conserved hypothetical protein [Theileria orientalis strain Shintoku]|uniref:Spp2/MOS2 G-patch domain-containing protein n=1 Tax=Theileria orientalis strain Shintoku TaxID=869250 RepID=J4C8W9_THEOR|nr:conserved hypothetical protein [Theileria orientalis strain Shintoku]BAM41518.1 conserved hypothetical protein [Theileria orientalis strain Shintoku]|eukprot:XP_009691819.1 conserved hypothetical protein [Theileria orientalis strain Shintoku]